MKINNQSKPSLISFIFNLFVLITWSLCSISALNMGTVGILMVNGHTRQTDFDVYIYFNLINIL